MCSKGPDPVLEYLQSSARAFISNVFCRKRLGRGERFENKQIGLKLGTFEDCTSLPPFWLRPTNWGSLPLIRPLSSLIHFPIHHRQTSLWSEDWYIFLLRALLANLADHDLKMRRIHLAIIAISYILPVVEGLSLANFQQITSTSIPISCQLAYDSQISTCTVSDFENGCSASCQAALNSVANTVASACSGVSVSSTTLLAIVMNGGIVAALCPTAAQITSTLTKTSATSKAVSTTPKAVNSVTLPTVNPGVTGGEGLSSKTSTSKPAAQSTVSTSPSQSASGRTTSSRATATAKTTAKTTAQSAQSENGGRTSTTTSNKATTTAASQATQNSQGGSGGGSPFDISSSASRSETTSIFGVLLMAAWLGILLGR